jgi:23S rRNA pseudouridine1911/1915/1917 synthase
LKLQQSLLVFLSIYVLAQCSMSEPGHLAADGVPEVYTITIGTEDAGGRLDRVLATHIGTMSRSRVKALIKDGRVRQERKGEGETKIKGEESGARVGSDETVEEPNRTVRLGEIFEITVPPAAPAIPRGENIPLRVVFEDEAVIVIDKPAGLVVHPAAGNWTGTLVNALIAHCGDSLSGIGGVKRPGIVHRLDKDTSGLMVVAKTDQAHKSLTEQFAAHGRDDRMQRAYEAIVWGVPQISRGRINAALGRATGNRTKMAVVHADRDDAKSAVTHYEVLEVFSSDKRSDVASRVRCVLETGRTHQIRVHMSHLGHPLLGDPTYGAGFAASGNLLDADTQTLLNALRRQALHAVELGFEHPLTGQPLQFTSAMPDDIALLLAALRNS